MIPTPNIQTIIIHNDCVDGFLCELLLRERFPDTTVLRMHWDSPEHRALEPAPDMIFADFAPIAARAEEFFAAGAIVLDHHKSTLPIFERHTPTPASRHSQRRGVSGAVLVWEFLHNHPGDLELLLGDIVADIGIYDTWDTSDALAFGRACEAHAALDLFMDIDRSGVQNASLQDILTQHDNGAFYPLGRLLFQRIEAKARSLANKAEILTCSDDPTRIALLPRPSHGAAIINRAVTHLEHKADIIVSGLDFKNQSVSLRSRGDVDCAAIAEQLEGGGHKGAAGYPIRNNLVELQVLLQTLARVRKKQP